MMELAELDVLNKKICGFCSQPLVEEQFVEYCECPDGHLKVWYRSSVWNVCRICWDKQFLRVLYGDDKMQIHKKTDCFTFNGMITIDQFNIFKYSHQELLKKIEIFEAFS